jgi:hypothetical protein
MVEGEGLLGAKKDSPASSLPNYATLRGAMERVVVDSWQGEYARPQQT